MTFAPLMPTSGLQGWRFLQATYDKQLGRLESSPVVAREMTYFRDNIANVSSASELVADRTLLKVALGAFGLQTDLPNRAFIRQILDTAPGDAKGLANRMSDPRYKQLAKAFGFLDPAGPGPAKPGFAAKILDKYARHSFEQAVGETDQNMRIALAAKRELIEMVAAPGSDQTKWFRVLAHPPLRKFFETTFGLPASFGKIDIDQQRAYLATKSHTVFGAKTFADLAEPERLTSMIENFHLRSQINLGAQMDRNAIALALLAGP